MIGLFLYALGIVVTIRAGIGYAPWDVLHTGISANTGFSLGIVSIGIGFLIIIFLLILRERLGLGTILNMLLIGIFIDIIMTADIIPAPEHVAAGAVMLVTGLFIISFGSYFYIRSAFGIGPRDNLMVVLARKTKFPVGLCRGLIELLVTATGWFLGGMVGLGTVVFVIGIGFCIQTVFRLFRFDVTSIRHETLNDTFAAVKRVISRRP